MILQICTFHSRMSLNSFLFLDSPVCISCQCARLCTKWERANLAHTWRANWSDLSWLSLDTGRDGETRGEAVSRYLSTVCCCALKRVKAVLLPSSCAMLCLWLTDALFHTASSTRLPSLEQAMWTYWPWERKKKKPDPVSFHLFTFDWHSFDHIISTANNATGQNSYCRLVSSCSEATDAQSFSTGLSSRHKIRNEWMLHLSVWANVDKNS